MSETNFAWSRRARVLVYPLFLLLLISGSAAAASKVPAAADKPAATKSATLLHASLNLSTLNETLDENPLLDEQERAQQAGDSQGIIERIDFVGNRRIRSDTLQARIFSRPGDAVNDETLRRDFQALWNTQFFEDVKLRLEDSPTKPNYKIVVFEVKERPVIRRIRYEGIHSVSESDILDRFKEKKVGLTVESQFDPTRIKKAEVTLRDLLGEHGRQFATVTPQYERIASSNAVILTFKVDEGPKVKVGKITFEGNKAFSDRKLIRAMRHDRPYAIPLYITEIPVMAKTYDHDKLIEDIEVGVRGLYQDNGYFKVLVKDPILENVTTQGYKLGVPFTGKSEGKSVNIKVSIEEGEKFKMGTLKIVSADPDKALSLKVEALKTLFPLKEGDVFSAAKVRKSVTDYGNAYGEFGFIDFTPEPQFDIDEEKKKIDVTLKFSEGKQYYVRRIDFSGNTTTRDKVIRRELLIDEGQLFNKRAWEMSILRLNQLDYFDKLEADKAAEIKRNTKEGTVDLLLKLKEKGKQSIGLQGGVSGLSGGFIGLTYQTNNFLGLGETLTFSAQFGAYQRSLMFGFTEPYLLDRPITTGFTVFYNRYQYNQAQQAALLTGQSVSINPQYIQNYNQNTAGFTAFMSYPLKRRAFTRVGLTYSLSKTNITTYNQASQLLFTQVQYRSFAGPNALNGIIASTLTPTYTFNTINNPINATNGKSIFYSLAFTGGPLGGNVNTITNTGEFKYFHPTYHRRNAIGFRVLGAFTTGYAGKEVPPYSRFYLGGDNDVRGFDIRSITPITFIPSVSTQAVVYQNCHGLSGSGNCTPASFNVPVLINTITFPGGDLQGVANVEYRIPIAGPVGMTLFVDTGTNGIIRPSGLRLDPTGLANIQDNFHLYNKGAQLVVAPGTNFKPRMSTGIEFNINLPIVQAPFRIYYAYNPLRIHQQIVAPVDLIDINNVNLTCKGIPGLTDPQYPDKCNSTILGQLNPLILNPGRLNYFEPKTTFRFSVSRTF